MTFSQDGDLPLTPRDDEWEPEFDPTYDEKTAEGGVWEGLTDHEIVLRQIEEFNWAEYDAHHQRLDALAEREAEDD